MPETTAFAQPSIAHFLSFGTVRLAIIEQSLAGDGSLYQVPPDSHPGPFRSYAYYDIVDLLKADEWVSDANISLLTNVEEYTYGRENYKKHIISLTVVICSAMLTQSARQDRFAEKFFSKIYGQDPWGRAYTTEKVSTCGTDLIFDWSQRH